VRAREVPELPPVHAGDGQPVPVAVRARVGMPLVFRSAPGTPGRKIPKGREGSGATSVVCSMNDMHTTDHEGYDMDCDELGRFGQDEERLQSCGECGRDWRGISANQCPQCHRAGGAPVACFQGCTGKVKWDGDFAECQECDARYPLEVVRVYRLGQLVHALACSTETGSAAEVGQLILRTGRTSLRRVS
jgi:hypothetical protein